MRPSIALQTHREAIRTIALSHRVTNVRVFGSVVHGDDTEGSDLDILVPATHRRGPMCCLHLPGWMSCLACWTKSRPLRWRPDVVMGGSTRGQCGCVLVLAACT